MCLLVGNVIPGDSPHLIERGFDVVALAGTRDAIVPVGVCRESGVGEFYGDAVLLAEVVCDFGVFVVSHSWFSPFYLFFKEFR